MDGDLVNKIAAKIREAVIGQKLTNHLEISAYISKEMKETEGIKDDQICKMFSNTLLKSGHSLQMKI